MQTNRQQEGKGVKGGESRIKMGAAQRIAIATTDDMEKENRMDPLSGGREKQGNGQVKGAEKTSPRGFTGPPRLEADDVQQVISHESEDAEKQKSYQAAMRVNPSRRPVGRTALEANSRVTRDSMFHLLQHDATPDMPRTSTRTDGEEGVEGGAGRTMRSSIHDEKRPISVRQGRGAKGPTGFEGTSLGDLLKPGKTSKHLSATPATAIQLTDAYAPIDRATRVRGTESDVAPLETMLLPSKRSRFLDAPTDHESTTTPSTSTSATTLKRRREAEAAVLPLEQVLKKGRKSRFLPETPEKKEAAAAYNPSPAKCAPNDHPIQVNTKGNVFGEGEADITPETNVLSTPNSEEKAGSPLVMNEVAALDDKNQIEEETHSEANAGSLLMNVLSASGEIEEPMTEEKAVSPLETKEISALDEKNHIEEPKTEEQADFPLESKEPSAMDEMKTSILDGEQVLEENANAPLKTSIEEQVPEGADYITVESNDFSAAEDKKETDEQVLEEKADCLNEAIEFPSQNDELRPLEKNETTILAENQTTRRYPTRSRSSKK